MIDENLVRVKFYLSSPNGVDSNGKPIGRRTLEYLMPMDMAIEMFEDSRKSTDSYTICAKRFSHGTWVDVLDTILLANVSWIEWPVSIYLDESETSDDDSE